MIWFGSSAFVGNWDWDWMGCGRHTVSLHGKSERSLRAWMWVSGALSRRYGKGA